jgi:hypothetical protein
VYFIGDGATASSVVWSQTVTGLTPGLVYKFQFYYAAGNPDAVRAVLQTTISDGTLTGANITANNSNAWTQALYTFTPTGTTATITLTNLTATGSTNGNDFFLDNIEFLEPCTVMSSINVLADCALPVELIDFNVKKNGADALLSWSTSMELNSSHFVIEKSTDGFLFSSIGRVEAAGNSNAVNVYNYTDFSIAEGITYYRLAQYDLNGDVHYSVVRALHHEGIDDIIIMPNPNNGVFTVMLTKSAESEIYVLNVLGQFVYNAGKSTSNFRSIDISDVAAGTYYLMINSANESLVKKIIKE